MVGRRLLAVQPALVASQHPAVLLLGGPSTEKVNLYLPKLPDGADDRLCALRSTKRSARGNCPRNLRRAKRSHCEEVWGV